MNFFQLIFKQIRQRSLSTILTIVSIALGVALSIAILVIYRESRQIFGQNEYGYEVIAGVKGSGLQLTVNTVYRIDRSPGNIPYSVYEELLKNPKYLRDVRTAIPQCVGDSYEGLPIVGTIPQYFGYNDDGSLVEESKRFEYRPGKSLELEQGKMLVENRFQAVIGAEAAKRTGLKVGDHFHATHGMPQPGQEPDVHDEEWTVVGILKPTHTANDKCIFIGLTSFFTIFEHGEAELARDAIRNNQPLPQPKPKPKDDDHGHEGHSHEAHEHEDKHYTIAPDGTIKLDDEIMAAREVSAILIKTRSYFSAMNLMTTLNLQPDVMAVSPGLVMREFFSNFLDGPVQMLLVIAVLVIVIASIGIMTTIYNSVAARSKEIAILRALGATRTRILLLITIEAALLGLVGGLIGFLLGHLLSAAGSAYLMHTFGEGIGWTKVNIIELYLLIGVVIIAFLAGLVPALKAYRVPVATNLVAS